MPRIRKKPDLTIPGRPYPWWTHVASDEVRPPQAVVYPGEVGWSQFTDRDVLVAGLDVVARKHIIRQSLYALEDELKRWQPKKLDAIYAQWGTFCAAMLLRRLTQGGKRTWKRSRRGKRGLLESLDDLERPYFITKRTIPDCIWLAQERALEGLYALTVPVPSRRLKAFYPQALNAWNYRTTRGSRQVGQVELHNRVLQVYRYYGVAVPAKGHGSSRAWSFYPWRLWRIDHQFELYRDVRLASVEWLVPEHFVPYLRSSQAESRKSPFWQAMNPEAGSG